MAIIVKPNTFSAGATIIASEHNANFDVIFSDYNGNITNSNLAANAAIVDTKLATISTSQKVNTSALVTTSQVVGDILYADTTTTYARLGIGGPTHFLVGGTTPSYRQINLDSNDVGNLPVSKLNGGTNASSTTFWRGDATWAVDNSFSNVIYADSWAKTTTTYEAVSANALSTTTGANDYKYWANAAVSTTFVQVRDAIRWTKIAGVSTITFIGKIWSGDTQTVAAQLDVGGQTGDGSLISANLTPTETTVTCDVSALSDGTTYDIKIKLKRQTSSASAFLGEFVLLGS